MKLGTCILTELPSQLIDFFMVKTQESLEKAICQSDWAADKIAYQKNANTIELTESVIAKCF